MLRDQRLDDYHPAKSYQLLPAGIQQYPAGGSRRELQNKLNKAAETLPAHLAAHITKDRSEANQTASR